MVPTPKVAITELTRILVTMNPFTSPISAPASRISATETEIGRPLRTMRPVTSTPCRLAAKPIERSSSPTITASVRPPAMIMASEAWLITLVKLLTVGKAFGDRIAKATSISARPKIVA